MRKIALVAAAGAAALALAACSESTEQAAEETVEGAAADTAKDDPSAAVSAAIAVVSFMPPNPTDRERAGFGNTLKMTSLKTPSVPHAPQFSLTKSSPVTFFITRPPDLTTSPRPVTKRTPIRLSRQAPTAIRRGPETFPATIPPIVGSALVPNNTR